METSQVSFMLNPGWILEPPIDFEYKRYILLSYLKKCEEKFNKGEVYPYFIELSLHFANAHVFEKENKILYTDKIFKSPDDELLINELKTLIIPSFTVEENIELHKINKYFASRVYEFFSVAKAIWSLSFESTTIVCKKNKKNIDSTEGFIYYKNTFNQNTYIWKYHLTPKSDNLESKCDFNLIFQTNSILLRITPTIKKLNLDESINELPLFEAHCSQNFPIVETQAPIFKRKLMNFLYQRTKNHSFAKNSIE